MHKEPLFHIVKRDSLPWYKSWSIRLIAVVAALILSGLITLFLTGLNPISVYATMIDGAFGTDTYNSVVSFQNLFGLVPDGVIGPATWAKLYQVFLSVLNSVTSANIPYPGYVLKVGSTGSSVSMVQRYLFVVGSYFRTVPQPTIDGKFGNGTKSSVLAFQRLFGLTADGIVGRSTWNRLVGVYDTLTAYI